MATSALNKRPRAVATKTGIETAAAKKVAGAVSEALADSFVLYVKTLGVHWNVVGPEFYGLHKLTEEQYEDLEDAIDELAERVRSLGQITPASFDDFSKLACIKSVSETSTAQSMISALVADNQAIAKRLRDAVEVAEDADDVFTADMLTARIGKHEQNAWMLRSIVQER